MASEPVRELTKVPIHGLRLRLNGDILELTKQGETFEEYKKIDMSKYDVYLRGVDTDGFLLVESLSVNAPPEAAEQEIWKRMHESKDFQLTAFNPRRRRLHGNVPIPPNFTLFLEVPTKLGGSHKVYVNHRKQYLVRVETFRGGSRLHNLGELGDPKSWIARFLAKFEEWHDWMTKEQIKEEIYKARMFDSQKLAMGLEILVKEGLIKKRGDAYASVNLKVDTPPSTETLTPLRKKKSKENKE